MSFTSVSDWLRSPAFSHLFISYGPQECDVQTETKTVPFTYHACKIQLLVNSIKIQWWCRWW